MLPHVSGSTTAPVRPRPWHSWSDLGPPPQTSDPRRPPARRRPLRLRPVEGPARAGRRSSRRPSTSSAPATASPGEVPGRLGAQRAHRAVLAARRLGGRARQRRHHRVLGRRHLRSDRGAQPAPRVRRVLVEVRRACAPPPRTSATPTVIESPTPATTPSRRRARRRPLRAHPQRDVDRRGDAAAPPAGADPDALVAVDATSAPAACAWDPAEVDVYYFAPQKCFASDGGLWLAACSPAAVERIERIAASDRWRRRRSTSASRSTTAASRPDLQHPGRRHAVPARQQLAGSTATAGSTGASSAATGRPRICTAGPRRATGRRRSSPTPAKRSSVVGTIDLDDAVDADDVCAVLRANGIVDTDSYRKLGRNQLRVGMFPAIDPSRRRGAHAVHRPVVEALARLTDCRRGPMDVDEVLDARGSTTSGRCVTGDARRPHRLFDIGGWPPGRRAARAEPTRAVTVGEIDPDPFYDFTQERPYVEILDGEVRVIRWPENRFEVVRGVGAATSSCSSAPNRTSHWRTYADCIAHVANASAARRWSPSGPGRGGAPHPDAARHREHHQRRPRPPARHCRRPPTRG
jgi:hypothetical protein